MTQAGLAPFRGYHTIKLENYVPVKKGDSFTLVMKTHSMPLLRASNAPLAYGVSFATNGTEWIDLASIEATVTLKAYTKPLVDLNTQIEASDVTAAYNAGKYLTVTVRDVFGDVMGGVSVTVTLSNGVTRTLVSDSNGQVRLSVNGIAPGVYGVTIKTNAFKNYVETSSIAKITVKKATSKLTAKKKSFKKSKKVKKYTIVLKANGKALKKMKVTLKVKGKTYSAKTNSKGKATFKITKLTKKGKFWAVVKFAGNAYYNKASKKVKITVKA